MTEKVEPEEIAKALKEPKKPAPTRKFLSSGHLLLDLACSGTPEGAWATGTMTHFVGDSDSGKAQPLTSRVLTPQGWRKMGNLSVGDQIIDPDGGFGEVLGIYPQGMKEVFKVNLSDGTSTECCKDHLWMTQAAHERGRGQESVKDLGRIIEDIQAGGSRKHYIPVCEAVVFSTIGDLPMHPYLLGCLLGNGCLSEKGISFSSVEEEIVSRLQSVLPTGVRMQKTGKGNHGVYFKKGWKNPVLEAVRLLGLSGCKAESKFIPKIYLRSSVEDRTELLRGLLDTDGTSCHSGGISYSSASKRLIKNLKELVRSLGGVATDWKDKTPKYTYRGEVRTGQISYRVGIRMPDGVQPFHLARKAERITERKNHRHLDPIKRIVSIEKSGMKECQCIRVNTQRSLYVTDDYIVTHNTWLCMTSLAEAAMDPFFKDYRLILDASENGVLMDIQRCFGSKLAKRIEPPAGNKKNPRYSSTVEELTYNIDNAVKEGQPFVYIEDSFDALDDEASIKKFQEEKKAASKGEQITGSYNMSRAKKFSSSVRTVNNALAKTDSIFLGISQTRDSINTGPFKNKTHSGGNAFKFYSKLQLWSSPRGLITKKVNKKERQLGVYVQVKIKKNHITGRLNTITLPIFWGTGLDRVGGCVDYLVEEGTWKLSRGEKARKGEEKDPNRPIRVEEFDVTMPREELVAFIEDNDLQEDLESLVLKTWKQLEEACTVIRKPRYT